MKSMVTRLIIVSVMLLASTAYLAHATQAEAVPARQPLATLPNELDGWTGRDAPALEAKVLTILGADEYLNRLYTRPSEGMVGLFVAFYQSQREGDTMHSPLNCLPGSGWQPVSQNRVPISVTGDGPAPRAEVVNQFVIQKGIDRALVLYWYQSHGRVVANEYTSKMLMVYDAMRLNRTDAALVRVVAPMMDNEPMDGQAAARRATAFVQAVFPRLSGLLPS